MDVSKTTTITENGTSYKAEDIEDSYFGGRLKFRTKIVWPNVTFFVLLHFAAFYGYYLCLLHALEGRFYPTIYMYFMAFLGGEGTTVGAHRLWCHRSYKARRILRIILIIGQTIGGQNCCHTWVRDHRAHHKYTDTNADPHNAQRGLFFSHMGWLMMRKHPECRVALRKTYLADIENDPVVMFQKRHFKKIFFLIGILIPVLIPYFSWGEPFWNSVFINFVGRYVLLLHVAWTVNSLAHYYGDKPYDKEIIPTENPLVSFLCYGEGWHNYHHTFPWDYKTSEYGMKLNFSRDLIEFFEKIGWAYDLKEASGDMVQKRINRTGDPTYIATAKPKSTDTHKSPSEYDEQLGY